MDKTAYKNLFRNLFSETCTIKFWDGEDITFGTGNSAFKIIFNEPLPISDIITNPSVTLGEAYMHKQIEIDGNIKDVIEAIYNNPKSFLRNKGKLNKFIIPVKNSLQKSKKNVSFHYDIGNDFYQLWLDKTMTYSCGYFKTEADTLDQAQENKVDYILKKLNLQEGNTLLDIGCGWGELIIAAAKKYNVKAMGITLSSEQMEKANKRIEEEGLKNLAEVQLIDYRQIKDRSFDRIVSVGMIEHVGKDCLHEYFMSVNKLLNNGGISLLHCITSLKGGNNPWLEKYIFPGGYVPSMSELVTIITDESFHLIDLESLRRHYGRTLEKWTENFENSLPTISKMKDETFIRMWRLYLNACAASFNSGNIDIHQFVFSKGIANELPWTREYLYN
ncbi:class I SAM-dependent methyltransferase [Anaerosacchariphilus polymeriproducens]|uniref:Class I SAM-dependent methyltransferase n=2 Tax=Anaerosacchariphilus polymeriproducens TaxID=1812858 RepID=A0A371AWX8_9FIRM|nr:class I SAM-dependent methyltransferase [Anaerosacchariphilus polymeriproducens]